MKPKLLTAIRDYSWRLFFGDALAGVTVALVALPLSIAIAIASGADPKAGLVTAIVAGFLISLLEGSRVQIGGPTGAFIVVVFGIIEQHGFDGLLLATLMAGVILAIGGILRIGRFIALVPEPVIEGFTVGIALIIAVSQLRDLLGLSGAKASADLVEAIPALWSARDAINLTALGVGLFCCAASRPGSPDPFLSSPQHPRPSPCSLCPSIRSSRASACCKQACQCRRCLMSASP